jgi:hypothetical protein
MWENFLAIYIYIYIYIYINQSAYKNTLMKNKEDNNKWFSRTNLHESHYMVLTTDWWWRDWYLHDDMKKQEMVLYTDKLNSETFFEVNAPSKSNVSRNYKHIHSHFVETLRPPSIVWSVYTPYYWSRSTLMFFFYYYYQLFVFNLLAWLEDWSGIYNYPI